MRETKKIKRQETNGKWQEKKHVSDIHGQAEAVREVELDATEIGCVIGRPRLDPSLPV